VLADVAADAESFAVAAAAAAASTTDAKHIFVVVLLGDCGICCSPGSSD